MNPQRIPDRSAWPEVPPRFREIPHAGALPAAFLILLLGLALAGCGQCQVGPRCSGLTQTQVDRAINETNATPGVRRALCEVLSYSQTTSWGAGCVIEWR